MIEVDQDGRTVAYRALDVLLDRRRRAGANAPLGGHDRAGPQPAGEEVEEVHAVLDEDSPALRLRSQNQCSGGRFSSEA